MPSTDGERGDGALRFDDQVAIVTGAGRGMGRQHALELASRGAAVVVNDVQSDLVDEVVAAIEESGGRAAASYDSVATIAGGAALVHLAVERYGTVDVLVHNAGIVRLDAFDELSFDDLRDTLDVHLYAGFYVGQPAYRVMKAKGYGRIVLISSTSGVFGTTRNTSYSAAKAGLVGLCRALSLEAEEHGVRVNCVLPKQWMTPVEDIDGEVPFGKMTVQGFWATRCTPHSVSVLVAYLASAACTQTGEVFSANAGRYARVFTAVGDGWLAPDIEAVTTEDLFDHLDQILAHDYSGIVPRSVEHEVRVVEAMVRATTPDAGSRHEP